MITKAEAKKFVYETVIDSLKKKQNIITTGMLGHKATQKDVKKAQEQMTELAEFLEKKLKGRKSNDKADAGGESGSDEAPLPTVREPKA